MIRKRRQKSKKNHYCLFLNHAATNFKRAQVDQLTAAIRKAGAFYTVVEPESAGDLTRMAGQAARQRRRGRYIAQSVSRRGEFTALIACGGDGTFNLVARAAMAGDLPAGVLPLGRMNNIARSLLGTEDLRTAIKAIISGQYRKIDSARAGDQTFFGSIGMGFVPQLTEALEGRRRPKFGLGWSQLGARAAAEVQIASTVLKVESFRFEVSPILININLLPYTAGLPLSPASSPDDGQAEVIFDRGDQIGEFGTFARQAFKKKYLYGDEIRLYRGSLITCQPTAGRTLYLDGELLEIPTNVLEVKVGPTQVRVFC
jgi:diacylglycerol kinase family enzyme